MLDKEALSNSLRIAFKQPVDTTSKMTVEATRKDLVRSLVSMMFATRCSELSQLENPPFIMAAGSYGDYFYSPTRKAYTLVAIFKTGQWKQALEGLVSVTKQAYGMIAYLGMSDKLPNLCYYNNEEYSFNRPYSEKTAELIDEEVKRMVNEQYERAKKLSLIHISEPTRP